MFRVFRKSRNREPVLRRRGSDPKESRNTGEHHANGMMRLQRTVGNQIVQRLANTGNILAKLMIGSKNDPAEREADQVADRVMQMPEQDLQRQAEPEEEEDVLQSKSIPEAPMPIAQRQEIDEDEEVQRQADSEQDDEIQAQEAEEEEEEIQPKESGNSRETISNDFASRLQTLKGGGKPLPDNTRSSLENRFGSDFSGVRTHTGIQASDLAKSINAKAFTSGKDIVFGSGQYLHQGWRLWSVPPFSPAGRVLRLSL